MTSSIPNSFSADDLEQLLKNAVTEEEIHSQADDSSDNMSKDQMISLASKLCDQALEHFSGPMIHKAMMLTMLTRFIDWHTQMGERLLDEGRTDCAIGWFRDAGKLQAAMSNVIEVSLGPDDFTMNE